MRIFLSTIIGLLFLASCSRSEWRRQQGAVWNTTFNIMYEGDSDLLDSIYAVFDRVDRSLSIFTPGSMVNVVNGADSIFIDADFARVFETACRVSELSGARFDCTVGPLVELWGFGREKRADGFAPDSADIAKCLESVGITQCSIVNGMLIKKSPATQFNFSAIAKGYGCDLIGEMFNRNAVVNYMIEIGGELRLGGVSPRGKKWVVQIDAPVESAKGDNPHKRWSTIDVTDCGVATSGNYRNFHTSSNGKRYGHTLDPVTGYPVQTDVLSATVVAPTAMLADALATACMTMSALEAQQMIDSLPGVRCYLITE